MGNALKKVSLDDQVRDATLVVIACASPKYEFTAPPGDTTLLVLAILKGDSKKTINYYNRRDIPELSTKNFKIGSTYLLILTGEKNGEYVAANGKYSILEVKTQFKCQ
jgi:hypothetical protein